MGEEEHRQDSINGEKFFLLNWVIRYMGVHCIMNLSTLCVICTCSF